MAEPLDSFGGLTCDAFESLVARSSVGLTL